MYNDLLTESFDLLAESLPLLKDVEFDVAFEIHKIHGNVKQLLPLESVLVEYKGGKRLSRKFDMIKLNSPTLYLNELYVSCPEMTWIYPRIACYTDIMIEEYKETMVECVLLSRDLQNQLSSCTVKTKYITYSGGLGLPVCTFPMDLDSWFGNYTSKNFDLDRYIMEYQTPVCTMYNPSCCSGTRYKYSIEEFLKLDISKGQIIIEKFTGVINTDDKKMVCYNDNIVYNKNFIFENTSIPIIFRILPTNLTIQCNQPYSYLKTDYVV